MVAQTSDQVLRPGTLPPRDYEVRERQTEPPQATLRLPTSPMGNTGRSEDQAAGRLRSRSARIGVRRPLLGGWAMRERVSGGEATVQERANTTTARRNQPGGMCRNGIAGCSVSAASLRRPLGVREMEPFPDRAAGVEQLALEERGWMVCMLRVRHAAPRAYRSDMRVEKCASESGNSQKPGHRVGAPRRFGRGRAPVATDDGSGSLWIRSALRVGILRGASRWGQETDKGTGRNRESEKELLLPLTVNLLCWLRTTRGRGRSEKLKGEAGRSEARTVLCMRQLSITIRKRQLGQGQSTRCTVSPALGACEPMEPTAPG